MNKIPTLFVRDPNNMQLVTSEVNPEAAWVLAGEGVATIKRDGTNARVEVHSGKCWKVWKRRNPTREEKAAGAEPGYVLASRDAPEDKHHYSAVDATDFITWPDGEWSVEVLGPKVQGGVESDVPLLYPFQFSPDLLALDSSSFQSIRDFLELWEIEGVVWHHPDGRMAKVKRRDFGFPWPAKKRTTNG